MDATGQTKAQTALMEMLRRDDDKIEALAAPVRSSKLTAARKRSLVLALRAQGYSVEAIARVLKEAGIPATESGVAAIVAKALDKYAASDLASVERIRAQQLDRLDRLLPVVTSKAQGGDLKAVQTVLKLESLRARIAGTESPQQHVHSGVVEHQLSREEIDRQEAAWVESGGDAVTVNATDVQELPPGD